MERTEAYAPIERVHQHGNDIVGKIGIMAMDTLSPTAILAGLSTASLPRHIQYYAEVGSTMDVARAWIAEATHEQLPALILADSQTAGRGRMRRSWVASPGTALLFSLVLRPHWLTTAAAPALIWMAAVAVCEGIAAETGLHPRLKWPNDVLLLVKSPVPDLPSTAVPVRVQSQPPTILSDWHKIAGVLLEMSSTEYMVDWAIIGCGLNVSAHPPADISLRYATTNLSAALGRPVARLAILRALLQRLDYWHLQLQQGAIDYLFTRWRELLVTLQQDVQIETASGILTGYAEDVEPSGALRIRDANGVVHIISSGDVCL